MICFSCKCVTSDGVQCSGCKQHRCYPCGGISEAGYRKLGPDRRASWKCHQCKLSMTPASSSMNSATPTTESASLELVLSELRDVKRQIASLCSVVDDIKELKNEVSELKKSCQFASAKLDDYEVKFAKVDSKISEISNMQVVVTSTQSAVAGLKDQIEAMEQWSRLSNVEIRGVPFKKDENLFSVIDSIGKATGFQIQRSQLNYVSRVPTFSKDKSIVASFINRYVKENFIASARTFKELKASDIGFGNSVQRVFVNDHLTPASKQLLTKAKQKASELGYSYKWVKYGKVHIRKNDTSPVIIIGKDSDLNKIV